jgi:Na+/H+ antiporter NhaC
MGEQNILASVLENIKWMPMFAIFFGGLSFHLSLAILAHMFGIDMQWGATNKEKENSNFFKEIPKIINSFKWLFVIMILCISMMIYLGYYAPRGWEIKGVTAVVPLAMSIISHILLPFVLNPSLMIFNY